MCNKNNSNSNRNNMFNNTLELPQTSLGDEDWRFNDYDFKNWN
jgi:hypothetical protein